MKKFFFGLAMSGLISIAFSANAAHYVIDDVHSQFVSSVADGRKMNEEAVRTIADGRIFSGRMAMAASPESASEKAPLKLGKQKLEQQIRVVYLLSE